jgi:hypothetical protein
MSTTLRWDDEIRSNGSGLGRIPAEWHTKPPRTTRYTADTKRKAPIRVYDELDRELATSLLYGSDDNSDDYFIKNTSMKKENRASHHDSKQCQPSDKHLASEPMKHTDRAHSVFPRGSTVLRAMCGDSDDKPSKSSGSDGEDGKSNKKRNPMPNGTKYLHDGQLPQTTRQIRQIHHWTQTHQSLTRCLDQISWTRNHPPS